MDAFVGIMVVVLLLSAVIILVKTVRIVPQQRMDLVERLGRYKKSLSPGLNLLVPFVDAVRAKVAYQYLQSLPAIANGTANKVWILPTELTKALEGLGGALGGLGNMVGDEPVSTVDSRALEREAMEVAEAAAAEAQKINNEVRAVEAEVSGPADAPPGVLPAPQPAAISNPAE